MDRDTLTIVSPKFGEALCQVPEGWTRKGPTVLPPDWLPVVSEGRADAMDLFSGCAGLARGLHKWLHTVLLARMQDSCIDAAPILHDARDLLLKDDGKVPLPVFGSVNNHGGTCTVGHVWTPQFLAPCPGFPFTPNSSQESPLTAHDFPSRATNSASVLKQSGEPTCFVASRKSQHHSSMADGLSLRKPSIC